MKNTEFKNPFHYKNGKTPMYIDSTTSEYKEWEELIKDRNYNQDKHGFLISDYEIYFDILSRLKYIEEKINQLS